MYKCIYHKLLQPYGSVPQSRMPSISACAHDSSVSDDMLNKVKVNKVKLITNIQSEYYNHLMLFSFFYLLHLLCYYFVLSFSFFIYHFILSSLFIMLVYVIYYVLFLFVVVV